jgi:hypothetical protein
MDVLAGQRVQVERLDRDERLPLARLHLGDVALVEGDPAHHLDVEEPDPHRSLERLADRGVRLEEEVLGRLAVLDPLSELGRLGGELLVGEGFELGLEGRDVVRLVLQALEPPTLADAQEFLEAAELL